MLWDVDKDRLKEQGPTGREIAKFTYKKGRLIGKAYHHTVHALEIFAKNEDTPRITLICGDPGTKKGGIYPDGIAWKEAHEKRLVEEDGKRRNETDVCKKQMALIYNTAMFVLGEENVNKVAAALSYGEATVGTVGGIVNTIARAQDAANEAAEDKETLSEDVSAREGPEKAEVQMDTVREVGSTIEYEVPDELPDGDEDKQSGMEVAVMKVGKMGLKVVKSLGPAMLACAMGAAAGIVTFGLSLVACGPLVVQGVMTALKILKGYFKEFAGLPLFLNDLRMTERYAAEISKTFAKSRKSFNNLKDAIMEVKKQSKLHGIAKRVRNFRHDPRNDYQTADIEPYEITPTSLMMMRQMLCTMGKMNGYVQHLAGMLESTDERGERKATEQKILDGLSLMRAKMDQALQVELMSQGAYMAMASAEMVKLIGHISSNLNEVADAVVTKKLDLGDLGL